MFIDSKITNSFYQIIRNFSFRPTNALPVIKIPKYLTQNLNKVRFKQEKKVKQIKNDLNNEKSVKNSADKNTLVISGRNKKYNHYFGQIYRNKNKIPLISKEWLRMKTNGIVFLFISFMT